MAAGKGITVSCGGCLIPYLLLGIFGGFMLKYDLNHWVPVLHRAFPNAINNPGQLTHIWPWLFLAGIPLAGPAFVVAAFTFILTVLGIIG